MLPGCGRGELREPMHSRAVDPPALCSLCRCQPVFGRYGSATPHSLCGPVCDSDVGSELRQRRPQVDDRSVLHLRYWVR